MFATIFSFEFKRWLKTWQFYLYAFIFFGLGLFLMGASIGFFDEVSVTTTSLNWMNSPLMISILIEGTTRFLYFFFPTIIGAGIYRDFKYKAHHIFFSYPFTKTSYLMGKFWSAFCITLLISAFIGLGMFVATLLPWANQELLGPSLFWNYAQAYVFNIIPNMLLIGAIIFVITTLARSVYAGFAAVIAISIILGMVNSISGDLDNKVLAALIDPSGIEALQYYTKYWTINEANTQNLPIGKYFILNRAIWTGVALLFLLSLARLFQFSQQPVSFAFWKKPKGKRLVKNNFGGLFRIRLSKVNYDFSLKTQWANVWNFMKLDFKYIFKNKVILILLAIGLLNMISIASFGNSMYGTKTFPITANMLRYQLPTFEIFILAITFLGAGLLVHRGQISNMGALVDSTATPNWVFFIAKYLALTFIQIALLMVVVIGGVLIQSFYGYYDFELGLYLRSIFGITLFSYLIWTGLALAVQTIFKNYIIGFFALILFYFFGDKYGSFGVEQAIFFFNKLPQVSYSDLNGFDSDLAKYYVYVIYWLLFIGGLSGFTLLFWRRGTFSSLKERFQVARERAHKIIVWPILLFFTGFIALGSYLYYESTIQHPYYSQKDKELQSVEYEKMYKKYENLTLPRIMDVKISLDLYPDTRDFKAEGEFVLKNKNVTAVDSLLIGFNQEMINTIKIDGAEFLSKDTIQGFAFYRFKEPLDSGETTTLHFKTKNKPNTILRNNSPVLSNGTFINNFTFPSLGYDASSEISDTQLREKYQLPPKERMATQDDSVARQNTYIRHDSDWITFEATVSTSKDQIAIAPGYLQKEWTENNRNYFHYDMGDQKILDFYAFNSGTYEVKRDKWKDINIEIYYNKAHPYNIDRMVKGLKRGFDYYTDQYSDYQFNQARIIEFPSNHGTFAQSFANTIPFSESIGFIADVKAEENGVDYPFSVTAHELAHQWWAHQIIGANVQGSTMLSESLAEYSSLKVLEHEYGVGQMRRFLKDALDGYLSNRAYESKKEKPLMYNENQSYIHYQKGSMVFYALSDYIGENKLNHVLKRFIDKNAFQEAPFTTAGELVADIKQVTPDTLQYLIKDMFETITLYDNSVEKAEVRELENGKYEVDIQALVSKYRAGEKGEKFYADENNDSLFYKTTSDKEIKSLPLNDYIEVGVFAKNTHQKLAEKTEKQTDEKILYLKKLPIKEINNELKLIVDEKPIEVGIDPYNKLIDANSDDNRKKVKMKK